MKTSAKYLLVFIAFVILTAGAPENGTEKELRNIIEPLNEKYINSIMEDDLAKFLSLFTDDATVMNPFQPTMKGKHALTTHWYTNMSRGDATASADVQILDIWSSGNLIYERGSYQITFNQHKSKIISVHGSYFTVWEKQEDGSYKIKYDIANLNHKL